MGTFASLKKNSSNLQRITKELEKLNSGERVQDERFWKITPDKAGNGYALIRFLPEPAVDGDEGLPWVRVFDHGFQGPGGWYIENSLTTLGKKDPVSEYNSELWRSAPEAEQKDINSKHPAIVKARKQKRRLSYISNVLVIKDEKHPDNEGRVFLFKYGKKIFDKLNEAMNPSDEDIAADPTIKPWNPFDFWAGANFQLRIAQVAGFRNYDKSKLAASTAVAEDDAVMEKLWKGSFSLKQFIDPNAKNHREEAQFKSYEELEEKLFKVLGETAPGKTQDDAKRGPTTAERFKNTPKTERPVDPPFDPDPPKEEVDEDDAKVAQYMSLADDD